jgi:hypothetical protein
VHAWNACHKPLLCRGVARAGWMRCSSAASEHDASKRSRAKRAARGQLAASAGPACSSLQATVLAPGKYSFNITNTGSCAQHKQEAGLLLVELVANYVCILYRRTWQHGRAICSRDRALPFVSHGMAKGWEGMGMRA